MNWGQKDISAQNDQSMQGMFCPNCGRIIQPNTSFCAHCHAAILRRYCPGCNRLVPDSTQICPYCTTPATAKPRLQHISPTSVGTGIAIVVSLFLVIQGIRNTQVVKAKVASAIPPSQPVAVANIPAAVTTEKPVSQSIQQTEISTDEATRLNFQGHELIKQKRYSEAIPVLQQAVNAFQRNTTAPAYPYALFNLAQALRLSGNPKAAIPLVTACINSIADPEMAKRELELDNQAVQP